MLIALKTEEDTKNKMERGSLYETRFNPGKIHYSN